EATSTQDPARIHDHAGVAAQVGGRRLLSQLERVGVLSDEIVYPPPLAFPFRILLRPADGLNVGEPGIFVGQRQQLAIVTELVRTRNALQHDEAEWLG